MADISELVNQLPEDVISELDGINPDWKTALESKDLDQIQPFQEIFEKSDDTTAAAISEELWGEQSQEPVPGEQQGWQDTSATDQEARTTDQAGPPEPTFDEDVQPTLQTFLASSEFQQLWQNAGAQLEPEVLKALGTTAITEDDVATVADALADALLDVLSEDLGKEETWKPSVEEFFS
jgi:hypothetical protein